MNLSFVISPMTSGKGPFILVPAKYNSCKLTSFSIPSRVPVMSSLPDTPSTIKEGMLYSDMKPSPESLQFSTLNTSKLCNPDRSGTSPVISVLKRAHDSMKKDIKCQ